jgi:hypothetical protein
MNLRFNLGGRSSDLLMVINAFPLSNRIGNLLYASKGVM